MKRCLPTEEFIKTLLYTDVENYLVVEFAFVSIVNTEEIINIITQVKQNGLILLKS